MPDSLLDQQFRDAFASAKEGGRHTVQIDGRAVDLPYPLSVTGRLARNMLSPKRGLAAAGFYGAWLRWGRQSDNAADCRGHAGRGGGAGRAHR